jgi:tetratricopeptide (TPR) repeat protein
LELAKQLCRQEPGPASEELLRRAYLERIRQLRTQGRTRDAASLLDHVLTLGYTEPAWLEQLAGELVLSGNIARALETAQRTGNPQLQTQVLAVAGDVALAQGRAGRSLLPAAVQPQFDLILQAFAQLEAGQDEAAKESLQGIGLQSPFLEWKLFLRGLQAYYAGEDVRAVENWSRLRPDRLPARWAAPLRLLIDSAFRAAQPPETQAVLQRQADRLQGPGLVPSLRSIQAALSSENLGQAFRLAEGVVAQLKREAPAMVGRLARVFQAALVHFGDRPDLQRYRRLFGAPPDDPELARLEAIALERGNDYAEAHKFWQKYEKAIAQHPTAWPDGQADKVRALIWARMGENAARVPDLDEMEGLPPFFRDMPGRPRPLKPSAEECFDRSLKLDPDSLSTYQDLIEHYQREEQPNKIEEAARRLLARFPDHAPTLEILGDLRMQQEDYTEGLSLFQRARQISPLEPRLREKVAAAHIYLARSLAEAGKFDEARAAFQASLALDGEDRSAVWCKWAACEFKAGDAPRAEELIQKAREVAGHPLPVAYQMLVEATRLKLKTAIKKRFADEFTEALNGPPGAVAAVACLRFAISHRLAGVKYMRQKAHEKRLLAYLDRVPFTEFTEPQLVELCAALLTLPDMKRARDITQRAQKRFPANPRFLLFEADTYLIPRVMTKYLSQVRDLLNKASKLTEKLPPDEQKEVQNTIQRHEEMAGLGRFSFGGLGGPFGAFANIFGNMFGGPDEDDYEDEDDYF